MRMAAAIIGHLVSTGSMDERLERRERRGTINTRPQIRHASLR